MKQIVRIILAAAAVAALAVPAMAGDKLVVKGAGGATGNVFRVDDTGLTEVKAAFSTSDAIQGAYPIFGLYNSDVIRTKIRSGGIQEWYLNGGAAETGRIAYSTPGGGVGIGLLTGATYDQNQFNVANYPTLGTGAAAIAGIGYVAGSGIITIDKSTGNIGIGPLYAANPPTDKLDVNGNSIRIRTLQTPVSTAACNAGALAWDVNYIYVCTASGAWKRAALTAY